MRAAIDRFSALTLGWIPDLSRIPLSRQIVLGAVIALVFHLVALPLIALLLLLGDSFAHLVFLRHPEPPPVAAKPSLELVVMPPKPEKTVTPAFEEHRQMFDPRGLEASQQKPKDARFESDRDMVAGSPLPADGMLPLPSQEGRTDRPTADFADQDVRLQLSPETAKSDSASTNAQAASPHLAEQASPAQAPAAPTPLYAPQPVTREALAAAQNAPAAQKLPETAKMTHATPPPLPKVAKAEPGQIAVSRPSEVTQPGPITRPEAPPTPAPAPPPAAARQEMARLTTPAPLPLKRATDRFQESLQKTKIEGAISNRGTPGVDAIATPEGRWWMRTKGAISQNWNLFIHQRADTITTGTVKISFAIDAEGRVHDLRVESNSGNQSLEDVCLRAIRETPIPPPPPDVIETAPNHRIDTPITFFCL